jgi:putative ubiquitin-RnfH superfamily antitoxin RatB of RatAB toxin-antitoxin module
MVKIELVYVAKDSMVFHIKMELKKGTTVGQALIESGLYNTYPETKGMPVGIYAQRVSQDALLKEGDRIEVYRSLELDPKENRRQRARLNK